MTIKPYAKVRQEWREAERRYLAQVLKECHGSVNRAAYRTGCNRTWLYKRLDRLALRRTHTGGTDRLLDPVQAAAGHSGSEPHAHGADGQHIGDVA